MIARKTFTGTDFPGFICKECGLILFDYKNKTVHKLDILEESIV